jgi:hypothetical protein
MIGVDHRYADSGMNWVIEKLQTPHEGEEERNVSATFFTK